MRCCSKECWRVVAIGVTILAAVLLTAIPRRVLFLWISGKLSCRVYYSKNSCAYTLIIRRLLRTVWAVTIFRSISAQVQQNLNPLSSTTRSHRWPSLHRWVGRAYLIGELLSLCAAAALLPYEHAHPEHFGNAQVVVPVGLTLLATILTGFMGYIRIRQRQYLREYTPSNWPLMTDVTAMTGHRVWMMRNYALLITLPLSIILYMLFYLVPVVSAALVLWRCDYSSTCTGVTVGWRLSSARVLLGATHHCTRRWIHRAVQISASDCWTRTNYPQRRSALLVVNKQMSYWPLYTILRLFSLVQNGHAFTAPFLFRDTCQCHTSTTST